MSVDVYAHEAVIVSSGATTETFLVCPFDNSKLGLLVQDDNPEDLEARNISFMELDVKKSTALVDYELWSSVQTIHQRFRFCCEDGEWRVHDIIRFYQDADGKETAHSLMEAMQAYLK